MQLSSLLFIVYCLPALLLLYSLVSFSRRAQNVCLLVASLFLYAWGEPVFVLVLMLSILVNWTLGRRIARLNRVSASRRAARATVALAVALNGLLLIGGRYVAFLADTINYIFRSDLVWADLTDFPLGLSIFTLMAISSIVDIYRREAEALPSPLAYGLYLSFFPIMAAGPVIHYADVAPQIYGRRASWSLFSSGCTRLVIGLAKIVILAAVLGQLADNVFSLSALGVAMTVPASLALLGAAAFALSWYHLLSGYADMAIGLGRMFGFDLKENFNHPYAASSMTDFWRRWNISAVGWFTKYLFEPLRRRRSEPARDDRNQNFRYTSDLLLVWLLFGLWNGAGWTFCLWGGLNCLLLLFEGVTRFRERSLPRIAKHLYLIMAVLLGGILFRAGNLDMAMIYFKNLFGLNHNGFASDLALVMLRENYLVMLAAALFSLPLLPWLRQRLEGSGLAVVEPVFKMVSPLLLTGGFLLSVVYLVASGFQPAIIF